MLLWLNIERRGDPPFDAFLRVLSTAGVPFDLVEPNRVHLQWCPMRYSVDAPDLAQKTPTALVFSEQGIGVSLSGRYVASASPSIFQLANLLRLVAVAHLFVAEGLASHWSIVLEAVSREESAAIDLRYALATYPAIDSEHHFVFDGISIHQQAVQLLWQQQNRYQYRVEVPPE